jgi:hypothetical protein
MKTVRLLLSSAVAATLVGCTTQPTLTPGELNAHAAQYDGRKVRVRGWLVI